MKRTVPFKGRRQPFHLGVEITDTDPSLQFMQWKWLI
jgi:hypothetical protein